MSTMNDNQFVGRVEEHQVHETGDNGYDSEKTVSPGIPEPTPENASEKEDVPPDGGIAWLYVGCCFLINAHTWGINSVMFSSLSRMTYVLTPCALP